MSYFRRIQKLLFVHFAAKLLLEKLRAGKLFPPFQVGFENWHDEAIMDKLDPSAALPFRTESDVGLVNTSGT